jgi:5-methylcytosine-specific restriction endonuclease McrA
MKRQRLDPVLVPTKSGLWAYRGKVVEWNDPESFCNEKERILLIKQCVLREERRFQQLQREVEILENTEKREGVSREPISKSVRIFVWQRDRGQCVKCGSRVRLEFDHIIPIAAGGASTERNIQLLCEACNRSKGATI